MRSRGRFRACAAFVVTAARRARGLQFHLRTEVAATKQSRSMSDLWRGGVMTALVVGAIVLSLIIFTRAPLPAPRPRRRAEPAPVHHPARDRLHGHPDRARARAVRLLVGRAEQGRRVEQEPRRDHRGAGIPMAVAVPLPRRGRHRHRRARSPAGDGAAASTRPSGSSSRRATSSTPSTCPPSCSSGT